MKKRYSCNKKVSITLFFISVLVLSTLFSGCSSVKTGKASELKVQQEEIKKEFKDTPLPVINITDDPKKQETMEFVKNFISTIQFPKVDGYPVRPDMDSFEFVGFVINGNTYTTTTQFRIMTMKGPVKKQYTITVRDNGNNNYVPLFVREDK